MNVATSNTSFDEASGGCAVGPPAPDSYSSILLDGFSRLLHFLLEAEVDYLCGVRIGTAPPFRLNYRTSYHKRKLITPAGSFPVRVPNVKFLHPRVSIVKRAKRLAPLILDALSRILADGVGPADAATLIKLLWTLALPGELLASLAAQLTPVLKRWRDSSIASQSLYRGGAGTPELSPPVSQLRPLNLELTTPTSDLRTLNPEL